MANNIPFQKQVVLGIGDNQQDQYKTRKGD